MLFFFDLRWSNNQFAHWDWQLKIYKAQIQRKLDETEVVAD